MYILFDIGGTKMRIAVSYDGEHLGKPLITPTPHDFEQGMQLFEESVTQLTQGEHISCIAGGIAGPLDKAKTMLVNSPNIPHWINKPLKTRLKELFRVPVYLENDAALAGLGEAHFGQAQHKNIVAYLTISTGVGGVRIVDGKIERNERGFEPGHQIIQKEGELCPGCGKKGHLEGHIGGAALEKRFGKKPEEIDDPQIWDLVAYDLAVGLNNTIVHWSPDIVILGGSLMEKIQIEDVKKHLREILTIYPEMPEIRRSTFNDEGGLYGALALLNVLQTPLT